MDRLTIKTKQGWQLDANLAVYGDVTRFNDTVDKLAAYEEAEEQGRLVVLPCEPDNSCYAITQLNCEIMDCQKQDENGNCKHDCPNIVTEVNPQELLFVELLGLRLFLTREEAEAALREEGVTHE